ncbi:MAG: helix-hairpin-helix domain-containing protein [Kineosporiaceae bacterium]
MAWFALHSILMLSLAFVVGLVVGWLLWARHGRQVRIPQAPEASAVDPGTPDPAADPAHPEPGAQHPADPFGQSRHSPDVATAPVPQPGTGSAPDDGRAEAMPVLTDLAVRAVPAQAGAAEVEPIEITVEPDEADSAGEAETVGEAETAEVAEVAPGEPALIDDLTRIDGVTTAMATALAAEGLGSFFAVANAPEDHLRRALRVNRIRSAPGIAFWSARAAELAEEATAERAAAPAQGPLTEEPAEDPAPPVTEEMAAPAPEDLGPPEAIDHVDPPPAHPVPATRIGPGSAFRTVAHPSGPSWTNIGPASEDDLERISGIAPAIVAALREAGVANYTQLAAVRDEELRSILTDAGLGLPPTLSTWSVQAALLLQGDVDGAATLAGGLMVGREGT